jgi:hypothetical protein
VKRPAVAVERLVRQSGRIEWRPLHRLDWRLWNHRREIIPDAVLTRLRAKNPGCDFRFLPNNEGSRAENVG